MQAELDAAGLDVPIHILGVNERGLESGNAAIVSDRAIPWIQPAAGEDIWTPWQVEYRDVVILGPGNERIATYNLTVNNLADPVRYAELKELLLQAASGG